MLLIVDPWLLVGILVHHGLGLRWSAGVLWRVVVFTLAVVLVLHGWVVFFVLGGVGVGVVPLLLIPSISITLILPELSVVTPVRWLVLISVVHFIRI